MDETLRRPTPITARDVARILRRRAVLAFLVFVSVCAGVFYVTKHMHRVYEAQATVLLDAPGSGQGVSGDVLGMLVHPPTASLDTEMAKIQSRTFLLKVIQDAQLENPDPVDLRNHLVLSPGPGGEILEIVARASTAEVAQRIANTVSADYIAAANKEFLEKNSWTEQRLEMARDKALTEKQRAEQVLNEFTTKMRISDPTLLFSRMASRTVDARTGLADSQKSLPLQQEQLANLEQEEAKVPQELQTGYSLNLFEAIGTYKNQISLLQAQRADKLIDFAPDSDEVKDLDRQIKDRQDALADAQKNMYYKGSVGVSRNGDYAKLQSQIYDTQLQIKATQQNIVAWQKQLAALEQGQLKMAPLELEYDQLRRARDDANDAYERARVALLNIVTTRVTSPPYIHPLDNAILPKEPISPKPLLNAIMAVFLGLLLGVLAALMAEYFAGGFRETVIEYLPEVGGVPLLGSLPYALPAPIAAAGADGRGLPAPLHASFIGSGVQLEDALREIGYSLTHREPKQPVPVVLLTSVRGDDATATLAAQLTATLVRDGLRVTLVDADRDRPRLNRFFGAPDAPGLAEVLNGSKTLAEALHVGANGALRFLSAGSTEDRTLATEEGLKRVFKSVSAEADTDIVFVSGPSVWNARQIAPLEKAARGLVLLTYADGGGTPDETVARVRRLLSNGYRPDILGVVIGQPGASLIEGISLASPQRVGSIESEEVHS